MATDHSFSKQVFRRISRSILHRSSLWIVCIAATTAIALYQLSSLSIGNSLVQIFVDDLAAYSKQLEIAETLGEDSEDLVYLAASEGPSLISPDKLDAIRSLVRELEAIPEVEYAVSFVDLPNVSVDAPRSIGQVAARSAARKSILSGQIPKGAFTPRLYWPEAKQEKNRINCERLRTELLQNPQVTGSLLSADAECWGIIVKLKLGKLIPAARQIQLRPLFIKAVRQCGLGSKQVHVAGLIISQGWLFEEMFRGIYLICPLVLVAISLTVFLIFRHWVTIVAAFLIATIATLWALGFTMFCFGEISMLVIAAAPPVIITIATSDFIHLTSTYRTELEEGRTVHDAIERTVLDVGSACCLTSLTTIIGFLSLATVPVPATRHFAFAASIGVASAFVLQSIGLIIYARLQLQLSSIVDPWHLRSNLLLDWLVNRCRSISVRFPYLVIASSGVIVACFFWNAAHIEFQADFPSRFPTNHELRTSSDFFNQHFAGATHIELLVELQNHKSTEPSILQSLEEMETTLRDCKGVQSVFSVLAPLRTLKNGLGIADDRTVFDQPVNEAMLGFIETHNEKAIRRFVSFDRRLLRIYVQIAQTDFIEVAKLDDQLVAALSSKIPAGSEIRVRASGSMTLIGQAVRRIIASQLRGNWICIIAISVVMIVALGSIRIGLLAQLPNLIPLAILVCMAKWMFGRIDSDILGLPMIALGIAVDDTIHFLHRYRLQLDSGQNQTDALNSTFRFSGRAVVQSAIILCVGLSPCALSLYFGVRMMGTLLVFTLGCGLIADLLLVPALIEIGVIRWRKNATPATSRHVVDSLDT